ncbi:MAG: hypothetical protein KC442_17980, partial [Thermomicrobiales bacterium]|nr:hypothetical protein [Thermomicrobiales bacterium]
SIPSEGTNRFRVVMRKMAMAEALRLGHLPRGTPAATQRTLGGRNDISLAVPDRGEVTWRQVLRLGGPGDNRPGGRVAVSQGLFVLAGCRRVGPVLNQFASASFRSGATVDPPLVQCA